MKYKGILPERKNWVKVVIALAAAYMMYLEAMRGQWIYVPIALLVILACFFKKEHVISEGGVDIRYELFGLPMHNRWTWDQVTTLHTDYQKARPNVMLHIGKDIAVRTFVMTPSDCQAALQLAKQRNPSIYIEDMTEEERQRSEAELLHRQEVLRAQKATNQKAVKKKKK